MVSAGRAFYPVRYSRDDNEVDADFVLLDCERGEVSIKVFGRSDETHLAREKEKVAFYGRTFEVTGALRRDDTKLDGKRPWVSAYVATT